MKKVFLFLLISVLVISFSACSPSNSNAVIEFNDEVLESMVRTAMVKPDGDILVSDALGVTELNLEMDGNDWSKPRIHNLEALKYFTNLTSLNLNWALQNKDYWADDVDISALGALKNLESLQMACVNVSDISSLSNMTNLKGISIWGGRRIKDISALANLTKLDAVDLRDNLIADISPLAGLTNLTCLDVSNNLITSLSPLAGLSNLSELYVADNLVSDYAPLSGIASTLGKRDFEPIAQPQAIDFRDAVLEQKIRAILNIPTGDITIKDTEGISELYLGNPFQDVIPDDVKISDISALKYFPNLLKLELYFNNIDRIDAVRALPNLGILDLNGNKVNDIQPISSLSNLWALNLRGNQCYTDSLTALSGLTKLESLYLNETDGNGNPLDYSVLKDIYPNLTDKNFEIPE